MNWKQTSAIFCVVYIIAVVYALFYSPDILVKEFIGIDQLPTGTILVWFGLIAFSLLFLMFYPDYKLSKFLGFLFRLLQLNVLLTILWGVVSYLLSGNWANNFSGGYQYKVWVVFTAVLIVLPLIIYLLLFVRFVYLKMK